MNHNQEFHPEQEEGPPSLCGSANHFRVTLANLLRSSPNVLLQVVLTGSWLAEDEKTNKVVVLPYPKSDEIVTDESPGILTLNVPGVDPVE